MHNKQACHPAVSHTLDFVLQHLGGVTRRLLEVGCGDGALASALAGAGHTVVAIDSDPSSVQKARARGVNAENAKWPAFEGDPYDVVLFTRSLHHIGPLEEAVRHAADLLRPGELVLVEDFAFDEADAATAEWLRGMLVVLDAAGLLDRAADDFLTQLLQSDDALGVWQHQHIGGHKIHPWVSLAEALRKSFASLAEERAPYLYRYVRLRGHAAAAKVLRNLIELEERLIQQGLIVAIGRRFVGRRL